LTYRIERSSVPGPYVNETRRLSRQFCNIILRINLPMVIIGNSPFDLSQCCWHLFA
jgi:hypothetical protein